MTSHPIACASVLNPVYALAAKGNVTSCWDEVARESIQRSDNTATDVLANAVGGTDGLRRELNALLGSDRVLPARTWGRFLVTPEDIADLYVAMLAQSDSELVEGMMASVVRTQRFGVPAGIPTKAGWDLRVYEGSPHLVTRLVIIESREVVVTSSAMVIDEKVAGDWREALREGGPDAVVPLHEESLRSKGARRVRVARD